MTGLCRVCERQRDLCPDGITVVRHYLDRDVASVKRCRGGRKAAKKAG